MNAALLALTLATATTADPMTTEIERDPINDRVRATATLRAGDSRLEIGCTPHEVRRIWVRLDSPRWFRTGNAFNGNVAFQYRFDDRPARRMMWSVRERTALLVGRGRVERFIGELTRSRQLILRVPGPEGRRYDIVFEIDGALAAISRAREACAIPLPATPNPRRRRWPWQRLGL